MRRKLHNLRLWLKPANFDLGNGEKVVLAKLVGTGKEKRVYKILGSNQVIKVPRNPKIEQSGDILLEVQSEQTIGDLGIAFVSAHRYDPCGRWLIKEYVPDPTIKHQLRTGSDVLYSEAFVSALFDVTQRLRRAGAWMDMIPANWVLRFRDNRAYLLSLEPILERMGSDGLPPFESVFTPIWLGHRFLYRISERQLASMKCRWETKDAFQFWRKYFGKDFPQLSRLWRIQ